MTTPPPAPAPMPASSPVSPTKLPPTGNASLVWGIILCFIGFFPTVRFLSLTLLSIVRSDAFIFGQAIGTLIVVAVFVVPGVLLLVRSKRQRRAKREAEAAAAYGYSAN